MQLSRILGVIVCAVALCSCSSGGGDGDAGAGSGGGSKGSSGASSTVLALESDAHDQINAERRSDGKGDLVHDDDLRLLARAHSEDMRDRGFFDHENPDGEDPFERMAAAGIRYRNAGENILRTSRADPATSAVTGWMNSPGHRANILNGVFTHAGMGVATDGAGTFWFTQVFTRPASSSLVIVSWSESSITDAFGSSWSSLSSN